MKVNIVCHEDLNAWILGKFARRMNENLSLLGIESKISKESDPEFDINHFIIYFSYNDIPSTIDTLMITHIDDSWKLNLLKKHMETAPMGICMSKETMKRLTAFGIPAGKLSYVNPAHDGIIKARKIVVGLTCMVQNDGRKREIFLDRLAKVLDPGIFMFKIMGANWDAQVKTLRDSGFEVEYDSEFNYDKYVLLIPSLDYYLYMGQDEGQMGFVDALYAGVKTITTPQGYHLDAPGGIYHPFTTYEDLVDIFLKIEKEKKVLINSVLTWNWLEYTKKHVEIWKYLIADKNHNAYIPPAKTSYNDGIFSILVPEGTLSDFDPKKEVNRLRREYLRHIFYKIKDKLSFKKL
jgi:hypothetical protein